MKKLSTLFVLLVAIVMGAQAEKYVLGHADETASTSTGTYAEGIATFTCGDKTFTITNEGSKTNADSNFKGTDNVKRYGVKYSQNVVFTVNIPNGVSIKKVTFAGWANSEASSTKIIKINDEDTSGATGNEFGVKGSYNSWSYEFATAVTGSFSFVGKGAEGVFNITLETESASAPATEPSITTQPQNATYIIGSTDYPSMSVAATASKGELKYQWHAVIASNDVNIPGATAATLNMADYVTTLAAYLSSPAEYGIYCTVTDDNASVNSNTAKLTVKEAATPGTLSAISESATWNFSSITWNGESYKNAKNDFEFTDENASTEWIYSDIDGLTFASDFNAGALAFKGQYPIRSNSKKLAQNGTLHFNTTVAGTIKVSFSDTGSSIPEGGAVERYLNVNGKNTEFFTKRDGSSSDAKTAEVNVAAGDVYITGMGADGETPQAICITSIEFTASAEPAPVADKPTITKQPQSVSYVIGNTEYPNLSVEATASAGELKYQWLVKLPSADDFMEVPSALIASATEATLQGSQAISMLSSLGGGSMTIQMKCRVSDDNGSVESDVVTINILEPAKQTEVTESKTWDWSNASGNGTELGDTQKNVDILLSDAEGFVPGTGFMAEALIINGQYAWRSANDALFAQVNSIKFKTTVAGQVVVEYANTGNNAARTLTINSIADTGSVTDNKNYATSASVAVTAGEVVIAGQEVETGDAKMLRIRKVTFTADSATAINGVAEAAEAQQANVKVIRNGKLYIGNYNVAGQQVK